MSRRVVLTPGVGGRDGISALSRLVVSALGYAPGDPSRASVDVLALNDPSSLPTGSTIRVRGGSRSKTRLIAIAAREALRLDAASDVVCVHLRLGALALPFVARGARLTTVLVGIEAWRPLRRLERLTLARSHHLLAISDYTAQRFLVTHADIEGTRIRVCHPAILDSEKGAEGVPPPEEAGVWATAPGFALIVGRLAPGRYKGHDVLIETWPRVLARVPHATLVVAGDGHDRQRLQARVAGAGLVGRVVFLGEVPEARLRQLYRECAFLVMPARDEGFGLVYLEAMRAGKACIGGLGAPQEVIEDGATGLIVDTGKPEDVCRAVVRLFLDREESERMGRAGAALFEQRFTEAHFRRRFRDLLGVD